VLGVIVLGEPVGWNLYAGAAVVILGVAVAEGRIPGLRGGQVSPPPLPTPESGSAPQAASEATR
jgi:hypothetical protein